MHSKALCLLTGGGQLVHARTGAGLLWCEPTRSRRPSCQELSGFLNEQQVAGGWGQLRVGCNCRAGGRAGGPVESDVTGSRGRGAVLVDRSLAEPAGCLAPDRSPALSPGSARS